MVLIMLYYIDSRTLFRFLSLPSQCVASRMDETFECVYQALSGKWVRKDEVADAHIDVMGKDQYATRCLW